MYTKVRIRICTQCKIACDIVLAKRLYVVYVAGMAEALNFMGTTLEISGSPFEF